MKIKLLKNEIKINMSRETKVTDFKTKRINAFTGGKIDTHYIPDYPKDCGDGRLENSFIAPDGTYLGDYAQGWWYFKQNMLVCHEYPHGVGIVLKKPAKDYKYLDSYKTDGIVGGDDILGYYGYSHRGGQTFKIGDRLFDENYTPKEEDYTKGEWVGFMIDRIKSIKHSLKESYFDTEEEAEKNTPISDVIPFTMRGTKLIETWDEAKIAAKNISSYLG